MTNTLEKLQSADIKPFNTTQTGVLPPKKNIYKEKMITELEILQAGTDKYSYNPETGVVLFDNGRPHMIGKEAGTWIERKCKGHTNYYRQLSVIVKGKQKLLLAHRLAWFSTYGEVPDVIDHIEHANRKDVSLNRIKNLRNGTQRDNTSNRSTFSTSNCTGVSWVKSRRKWEAQIRVNGEKEYLGLFTTEKQASEAYQKRLAETKL